MARPWVIGERPRSVVMNLAMRKAARLLLTVALAASLPVLGVAAPAAAGTPPAPTPLAPANGASVVVPLTISWSAVSDPAGIIGYNWQVSPSSPVSPVVQQDSTMGPLQDTVSGLAPGTYFWRVQAASGDFNQGAGSAPSSLTVTGVGPGAAVTPVLNHPKGGTQYHPFESISFT